MKNCRNHKTFRYTLVFIFGCFVHCRARAKNLSVSPSQMIIHSTTTVCDASPPTAAAFRALSLWLMDLSTSRLDPCTK